MIELFSRYVEAQNNKQFISFIFLSTRCLCRIQNRFFYFNSIQSIYFLSIRLVLKEDRIEMWCSLCVLIYGMDSNWWMLENQWFYVLISFYIWQILVIEIHFNPYMLDAHQKSNFNQIQSVTQSFQYCLGKIIFIVARWMLTNVMFYLYILPNNTHVSRERFNS